MVCKVKTAAEKIAHILNHNPGHGVHDAILAAGALEFYINPHDIDAPRRFLAPINLTRYCGEGLAIIYEVGLDGDAWVVNRFECRIFN